MWFCKVGWGVVGHRTQDVGYLKFDVGCCIFDVGCWTLDGGGWVWWRRGIGRGIVWVDMTDQGRV